MAEMVEKTEGVPLIDDDVTKNGRDDVLRFNVRGKHLRIDKSLVRPGSSLYELSQQTAEQGVVFVNRNPVLVPYLRDYYHSGQLHLPDGVCTILLHEEVAFWGIPFGDISECCQDKVVGGKKIYIYI